MDGLAQFRQKNPSYDDMSDADLATALHQKYYSDLPRDEFEAKIGIVPSTAIHGDKWKEAKGDKLQAYEPTWRDQIASALMPDERSPLARQIVGGLLGSTGLGKTDQINAIDFTPARIPLLAQEAYKDFEAGHNVQGVANAVGALPVPVLNRAIEGVANVGSRLVPHVDQAAAAAAQRLGTDVPKAAMLDNSMASRAAREVAGGTTGIPIVGTPLRQAAEESVEALTARAQQTRAGYSGVRNAEDAGQAVKDGISEWIRGTPAAAGQPAVPGRSQQITDRLYSRVDALVPAATPSALTNTRQRAMELLQEDAQAAVRTNEPTVQLVMDAITRPNGLDFRGLRQLRTTIGAMVDDGLLPNAGTVRPGLQRLYGALTQDLEAATRAAGPQAEQAWTRANGIARLIAERRETLASIVGKNGDKSPEGVIGSIIQMASTRDTANAQKLLMARRAMGAAWDDVAAVSIERLGRRRDGTFGLPEFATQYSQLSENGRNILFSSTGRDNLRRELDDFALLAENFRNLQRFGNPSGSGRTVSIAGASGAGMAGLITGGLAGLGTVLAGAVPPYLLSRWMAQPARIRAINRFGLAAYNAAVGRGGDAAIKLAAGMLARQIADETGEDERPVAHRLITGIMGMGGN